MKNIMSYQPGAKFTGKEILDWAHHQVDNKTSHYKQGEVILRRFGNLKPDREYGVRTHYSGTGCGEVIYKPLIFKA